MIRGWIILSSLVLSVLFKLFARHGTAVLNGGQDWSPVHFVFSDRTLNRESWVYFTMEHIIAIAIACCLLIQDSTPVRVIKLFILILILDFFHYVLFYMDEGIGFNLFKVVIFGGYLLWTHFKTFRNT